MAIFIFLGKFLIPPNPLKMTLLIFINILHYVDDEGQSCIVSASNLERLYANWIKDIKGEYV